MRSRPPSSSFGSCPICGEELLEWPIALPGVQLARCRACGHRVAIHETGSDRAPDYHDQYDNGAFLDALRATRVRQAGRLIALLRKHVQGLSSLVDYGAGRGWFLEACRAAGVTPVAGVDTSRVSVEGLKASAIEAHLLPEHEAGADVLSLLSFRPRVISLLDVLEHFPPERLEARLRSIVTACGSDLELVVVKVPVAGLLYAGATALCRVGAPEPLLQLYQAGTWPPHFNYFSAASAERLLAAAGLCVIERVGDPDFEPRTLGQRIGVENRAARGLVRIGGEALAAAVRITRGFDSTMLLARPTASRTGRPQAL